MKGSFEHSAAFTKLLFLALVVVVCMLAAFGVSSVYLLCVGDASSPANLRMALFLQNSILFVGSALAAQYFLWKASLADALRLHCPPPGGVLLGILAMFSLSPFVDLLAAWNEGLHLPEALRALEQWMVESERQAAEVTARLLDISSWGEFWGNVLVMAVLAGVGEELLFRGVLQRVIVQGTRSVHAGVWLTAVLFSAVHLQFFGFVPRMVLGALLGYLFVWSRNLWVPVAAHVFNNLCVILFTPVAFNEGVKAVEAVRSAESNASYAVAGVLLAAACLYVLRKRYFSPADS